MITPFVYIFLFNANKVNMCVALWMRMSERPCPTLRTNFFPVNCLFSEWDSINGYSFFSSILCAAHHFAPVSFFFSLDGQIAHSHIEWKTHHIYRFWYAFQHIYTKYISTCNTHRKCKQFFPPSLHLTYTLGSSFFI